MSLLGKTHWIDNMASDEERSDLLDDLLDMQDDMFLIQASQEVEYTIDGEDDLIIAASQMAENKPQVAIGWHLIAGLIHINQC